MTSGCRTCPKRINPVFLTISILLLLGVLALGTLECLVLFGGRVAPTGQERTMIVLGAQVKVDGPSVLLADRLDTAADYLTDHPEMQVVVSGGQGDNEPFTEASCMKEYLEEKGIASDRIWMEEQSSNTAENIQFTIALLQEKQVPLRDPVVIVSNGFHLFRGKLLGERYGLSVTTLAAPTSHLGAALQSHIREPFAIVKSFLFD